MLRMLKWGLGGLILFCGFAALTLRVCREMDLADIAYANLREAQSRGAAQQGWLPEFLPASTRDIRLRDNISTNQMWMSFRMDPADASGFSGRCGRVSDGEIEPPEDPDVPWWPESLVGTWRNGTRAFVRAEGFEYFGCSRKAGAAPNSYDGWLALNPASGTAYYWENPR